MTRIEAGRSGSCLELILKFIGWSSRFQANLGKFRQALGGLDHYCRIGWEDFVVGGLVGGLHKWRTGGRTGGRTERED